MIADGVRVGDVVIYEAAEPIRAFVLCRRGGDALDLLVVARIVRDDADGVPVEADPVGVFGDIRIVSNVRRCGEAGQSVCWREDDE